MKRITKQVAVAGGFLFLWWAPGLTRAQDGAHGPTPTPRMISPAAQQKKDSRPPDDFVGLTYTAEQQAKIDEIHQIAKQRIDTVNKDEHLTPDVKTAMLDGYQRLEIQELFRVLTPQQQAEVRKKVLARRAAEQQAQPQKKQNGLFPPH